MGTFEVSPSRDASSDFDVIVAHEGYTSLAWIDLRGDVVHLSRCPTPEGSVNFLSISEAYVSLQDTSVLYSRLQRRTSQNRKALSHFDSPGQLEVLCCPDQLFRSHWNLHQELRYLRGNWDMRWWARARLRMEWGSPVRSETQLLLSWRERRKIEEACRREKEQNTWGHIHDVLASHRVRFRGELPSTHHERSFPQGILKVERCPRI